MFHDPRQRSVAIGIWVTSFSAGAAVGPLAGGLLLEHFWWGSVFLPAVPVMALLLALGPRLLPEYREPEPGRIDLASVALSLVAVLAVVYGAKTVATHGVAWGGVAPVARRDRGGRGVPGPPAPARGADGRPRAVPHPRLRAGARGEHARVRGRLRARGADRPVPAAGARALTAHRRALGPPGRGRVHRRVAAHGAARGAPGARAGDARRAHGRAGGRRGARDGRDRRRPGGSS